MNRATLLLLLISSVFVLADEKANLPLPSAGNVTLPISEYNHLLDLVKTQPKKPELPPLPYTIQHADLKFRVEKEVVMGTVQLEGEVLSKGESKVPLSSGMTILDAHQQGRALPLLQEGAASVAILPGASPF